MCRSGGIRTRGLLVPNQTRYQTALHLEAGADEGTRTPDLLITNRLLYQLSHIGISSDSDYSKASPFCPAYFFTVPICIFSGRPRALLFQPAGTFPTPRAGALPGPSGRPGFPPRGPHVSAAAPPPPPALPPPPPSPPRFPPAGGEGYKKSQIFHVFG